MRFNTLNEWLSWQESLHSSEIDLGLARIREVWLRLNPDGAMQCPVITVAGTNGKGSSVAMLEAIYLAAGYRVGTYTSPHLIRYNERIRLDGAEVDDAALCDSFERIDQARSALDSGETSLTYFEFGTLAALDIFARAHLDVVILEVGLGGRLDGVNIVDADVALITTIALDHADWLGNDREVIGREKAGIMRQGRPAVCGDLNPPASIAEVANEVGAQLYLNQKSFGATVQEGQWRWWGKLDDKSRQRDALPAPALRGAFQMHNAAAVLTVVELLAERLPLSQSNIREGLANVAVPGRFQVIGGDVPLVLDVAHNPEAAKALADNLRAWPMPGSTYGIVAMMADKDISAVFGLLNGVIDEWHVTTVDIPRAASADTLAGLLESPQRHESVGQALAEVKGKTQPNDRIVVFGSFYTVAEAMQAAYNVG
ncbi:bifunctional tetrahydrofolate synthase/dihydrofolate synthase [Pseudomonadota bacterium]